MSELQRYFEINDIFFLENYFAEVKIENDQNNF
jgi:hypothetical protein